MDRRQQELIAIQRGRKATRIIAHLDQVTGRRVTVPDVDDWTLPEWRRCFEQAGEHWNAAEPQLTVSAVLNRLAVRDKLNVARRPAYSHA